MGQKKYVQDKCVAVSLFKYRIFRNKITVVLLSIVSSLKLQGNVISF